MAEKKLPFDQQKNKTSNKQPRSRFRILKILVLVGLLLFFIVGGAGAAVVSNYINDAPPIDPTRLETVQTSYLYDSEGEEITALHEEQNRIVVDLDDIPEHVQLAFIAIEDERFEEHFGFDIIGSARAAYTNFRAGSIVQGASTITQQLAQNAFLTPETTYERKIQEIWLAIQLERMYSKDEILELYLNRIYFGNGAYGVEAAAQNYFDKSITEVDVNEAAMLAGAVRSPNYYNPFDNREEAERRMRIVLNNMSRLEFITEPEYHQALEEELSYAEVIGAEYPYPHYVDYVVHNELVRILSGIPEYGSTAEAYRAIYTGGLLVYTNLDTSAQQHVENVLANDELYPATYRVDMDEARAAIAGLPEDEFLTSSQMEELEVEEDGVTQPQAAIVLSDPTTGEIKALGGGREYQKNVDEVLRFATLRQPGSAIKPITTYAPAFEEGVLAGPGSTLDDSPYIGPREDWFPENFDYKFRGMIPVREALFKSYNIPAIRAFEKLGPETGAEYAERMGITTLHPDEKSHLSLTLGGFTRGVSAIDMNQAYSVLANEGLKVDLHTINKIVDRQGNVIYEKNIDPQQVISRQSAFLVNDILQDFVTQYLGTALRIDRPVAAKTGTTDDWKDVYLVAYTPNLAASFWMGYDEPRMGQIRQGWRYSTAFLREVFLEEFENLEVKEFERPEGIVQLQVCDKSGLLPNEDCERAGTVRSDYFLEDEAPTAECNMHDGRFYRRPAYIETDERWSSRGGPGRKPQDVEDMPTRTLVSDMTEQAGETTSEITEFTAFVVSDGVTLQWDYDGQAVSAFEVARIYEEEDETTVTELGPNARQYLDNDIELDREYTYYLTPILEDDTASDSARVRVSTEATEDGDLIGPPDEDSVVVPDVTGSFQPLAESALTREGLKIGPIERVYSDEVQNNRVISQRPEAGSVVAEGREVRLVVSRGPE